MEAISCCHSVLTCSEVDNSMPIFVVISLGGSLSDGRDQGMPHIMVGYLCHHICTLTFDTNPWGIFQRLRICCLPIWQLHGAVTEANSRCRPRGQVNGAILQWLIVGAIPFGNFAVQFCWGYKALQANMVISEGNFTEANSCCQPICAILQRLIVAAIPYSTPYGNVMVEIWANSRCQRICQGCEYFGLLFIVVWVFTPYSYAIHIYIYVCIYAVHAWVRILHVCVHVAALRIVWTLLYRCKCM